MDARMWNGLVMALRSTVLREAGTAEELVHLQHFSRGDTDTRVFKGIHKILYKNLADLPALLRGELVSDLNPRAAEFVPTQVVQQQADTDNDDGAEEQDDSDDDEAGGLSAPPAEEDSGIDHALDLEAAARAADEERVEQVAEPPTEEEVRAATFITQLYRRKLLRRRDRDSPKKGREAERERYYQMYREQPPVKGANARYKAIFLGFVPLVLFCLESYNTHVIASKKKAMVRRDIAPHHQYESVMAQIDCAM
ncbi:hypothetical protein BC835DRAFT_1063988 [Cytidiella melzeri]|nr:hypothetical protein BC835DRAFT_1063988 [Cytidiella melzeri]